jgi:hypothetical protein
MRVRKELIGFIAVIQSVLFLTHCLLYETWTFSPAGTKAPGAFWIKLVLGFLSVSFIAASLLAFRYTNAALRAFYRTAAAWMGLVSFLFLAAVSAWIIFGVARITGLNMNFHRTVELLFGTSALAGLYGVFNAGWTRITRTTVRAKSGADQRCAPWARAKRQFSTAPGCEDCKGRARRDFCCR